MEGPKASGEFAMGGGPIPRNSEERKSKFMPYADDTIWLLFALGLGMIVASLFVFIASLRFSWAPFGFLVTGILVSASYYLVGSHPPGGVRAELNASQTGVGLTVRQRR